MTYNELIDKWSRNINSEYIMPDLYKLSSDNLIIPKEDLKVDKGKFTFVFGGNTYKIKVKKVRLLND